MGRNFNSVQGTQTIKSYANLIHGYITEPNKSVLMHLLELLHEVSKYSEENKMMPSNLAIVWAPNLLRDKSNDSSKTMRDMDATFLCIEELIEQYPNLKTLLKSSSPSPPAYPAPMKTTGIFSSLTNEFQDDEKMLTCSKVLSMQAYDGFLDKTGERNTGYKKRYFRLLDRGGSEMPPLLLYYDRPGGTILGTIRLDPGAVRIQSLTGKDSRLFTIAIPGRVFTLRAQNFNLKRTWVKKISTTMAMKPILGSRSPPPPPPKIPSRRNRDSKSFKSFGLFTGGRKYSHQSVKAPDPPKRTPMNKSSPNIVIFGTEDNEPEAKISVTSPADTRMRQSTKEALNEGRASWFYRNEGNPDNILGPVQFSELEKMYEDGKLKEGSLCWNTSMGSTEAKWEPIKHSIDTARARMSSEAPPPPPPARDGRNSSIPPPAPPMPSKGDSKPSSA